MELVEGMADKFVCNNEQVIVPAIVIEVRVLFSME